MKIHPIGKWLIYRAGLSAGIVGMHFVPVELHLPFNIGVNLLWIWLL